MLIGPGTLVLWWLGSIQRYVTTRKLSRAHNYASHERYWIKALHCTNRLMNKHEIISDKFFSNYFIIPHHQCQWPIMLLDHSAHRIWSCMIATKLTDGCSHTLFRHFAIYKLHTVEQAEYFVRHFIRYTAHISFSAYSGCKSPAEAYRNCMCLIVKI